MADAIPVNRWTRTLVTALAGCNDSLAYAVESGDTHSAAILCAMGRGFISEPWHPLMSAFPGWSDEVARFQSLAAGVADGPIDKADVEDWTATYLENAERQVATDARLEQRRCRRREKR